jgi:dTDP-4-amino-4,6-dideoxygalactose transaminase
MLRGRFRGVPMDGGQHDESIPLARPDLGPEEEAEVMAVLRSGRLALGPRTEAFERLVSARAGTPWAAAVSSGTAGLHLAVRALGVGSDDCVVTSSFSFIASANCIRYEGGEPVFVDIDPETLGMSPEALRAYLEGCKETDEGLRDPGSGRRVAAVLPVDVFGHPVAWEPILALAARWDLPVLADSCEALGSRYRRGDGTWVHTGTEAMAAVFAFYPNKQITTGEGGMVVGSDPSLEGRIRSLRNHGRKTGDAWLVHTELGFNYRMDELSAALGVAQMGRLDDILERRRRVAAWYDAALVDVDDVQTPTATEWADPAWFVYFLRVGAGVERDRLVDHLSGNGIESKAYFDPPIHRQRPYAGRADLLPEALPETEAASTRTLILPFYGGMREEDVDRVGAEVKRGLLAARNGGRG